MAHGSLLVGLALCVAVASESAVAVGAGTGSCDAVCPNAMAVGDGAAHAAWGLGPDGRWENEER